ncbi:MAG TPA: hypothetical protein VND98_05005 [Solirubrobacterales bacterium]|nr:hypothetical protein [Solirubrobacterales bacterium]
MKKTSAARAALVLTALLLISGCGSSSSSTSSQSANPTVVSTAPSQNPKLRGTQILVDSKGLVLYAFSKDPENTFHSHCLGRCEATWPPLILSGNAPVASGQALGTQLGAVKRSDGKLQVDYAGHLLYTYVLERKSGEALGNGVASFGGTWQALSASGRPVSG